MSDTPAPQEGIDVDAVKALLQAESDAPRESIQLTQSTADEVRAALGAAPPESDTPAPKVDIPLPAPFQPNIQGLQQLSDWIFSMEKLGTIEVTEMEKNLYWKSFLNDAAFAFDIPMVGVVDILVKVRTLTAFGQFAVAAAMKLDERDGIIVGVESQCTMMQQYFIVQQIVSIDAEPFPLVNLDDETDLVVAADKLRDRVRKVIWKMNSAKLSLLIKAVTIFEIKQKLCNEAVVNKDKSRGFWLPPGSA
jgi:hypothetical protein